MHEHGADGRPTMPGMDRVEEKLQVWKTAYLLWQGNSRLLTEAISKKASRAEVANLEAIVRQQAQDCEAAMAELKAALEAKESAVRNWL